MVQGTLLRARVSALRCTSSASPQSPLRRADWKKSPDLISTPLHFPLEVSDKMKVMSLGKGSFLLRVKCVAEPFAAGSIFLGIRFRKDVKMLGSWHEFSRQDLCHNDQLLIHSLKEFRDAAINLYRDHYLTNSLPSQEK